MAEGLLVLAATPIGDQQDASPALIKALSGADLIAAEDTRRFRRLSQRLGLTLDAPVMSYFEANEVAREANLLQALADGQTVVVVSDAGMPGVSDPGFRLVRAAIAAGIRVTVVPGPSAVLTALVLSGLPVDRFCFEGFLPRKAGPRAARLDALRSEERTMVFFEAPHRVAAWLTAAAEAFGPDRPMALCRELTKVHEEVIRGSVAEVAAWAADGVRGEVTLVVAGVPAAGEWSVGADQESDQRWADLVTQAQALVADGLKPTAAAARVAAQSGVDRRQLYAALVKDKAAS
ncbi:MAG: 16S rRNA (cytidine(1402)-2'-O)-methyltransferase [Propionibacteriaceae bacterium]|nr:16S rRNA (cytidine(1402)-2'-O)-methyltransferase [Propionibacteriaceae bacterium]